MTKQPKLQKNFTAFTLVELLLVIGILGSLAALLLAASLGTRKKADSVKCLNSMRQIGIAIQLYTSDSMGHLPDTGHVRAADGSSLSWVSTLSEYLGSDFIGRCPSYKNGRSSVTYGWNDLLAETDGTGIPLPRCRTPSSTLVVAEHSDSYSSEHFHFRGARSRVTYNQFKSAVGVQRHGNHGNYLFVDGHVEALSPSNIQQRLSDTNLNLLQP